MSYWCYVCAMPAHTLCYWQYICLSVKCVCLSVCETRVKRLSIHQADLSSPVCRSVRTGYANTHGLPVGVCVCLTCQIVALPLAL